MWSPSRAANQRWTNRKSPASTSINMWPFVAVMVALLMLFMSRTRPHQYRQIRLTFPRAHRQPRSLVRGEKIDRDFCDARRRLFSPQSDLVARPGSGGTNRGCEGAEKKVYISAEWSRQEW